MIQFSRKSFLHSKGYLTFSVGPNQSLYLCWTNRFLILHTIQLVFESTYRTVGFLHVKPKLQVEVFLLQLLDHLKNKVTFHRYGRAKIKKNKQTRIMDVIRKRKDFQGSGIEKMEDN